ncbi:MAG TPA: MarR family transcriptional regulator [Flavobacteriales bacterium]|nr:MarR family transcriptional regulator [Flavobacteriales bacterium]
MTLKEGRENFIQAWGTLGASWGINKAMAQIHALMLISAKSMSTEEIMEELSMSRGNTNMNVRTLIDWGLLYREHKVGDRKEYFYAEKDIWEVARRIARERRKRELEPVLRLLTQFKDVKTDKSPEAEEFKKMTAEITRFSQKADGMLDKFIRSDEHWFYSTLLKLMK